MDQTQSESKFKKQDFEKQFDLFASDKIHSDKQIEALNDEIYALQHDLKSADGRCELFKQILFSLLYRAEELIFQKNLLKMEYSFLSNQLRF
jgi:hypothetical protein